MNKKSLFSGKSILIFLLLIFISLSFVSADKVTNVGTSTKGLQIFSPDYMYVQQNSQFSLHLHVSNISNGVPFTNNLVDCYLHLYNSTGHHTFESGPLEKDSNGEDFEILINNNGGNFSDLGVHSYYIWCNRTVSNLGGEVKGTFEVTLSGTQISLERCMGLLFMIFVLSFGIFSISYYNRKIDYEKWYDKMVRKYQDKNYLKWGASALWYNIMKNNYILSYLLGILIMICLRDVTYFGNLYNLYEIFTTLLTIYLWGSLVVIIIFFSNVQEWLVEWKEDIANLNWGVDRY